MAPFRTRTTDTAQLAQAALAEHTLLASYMDSVDAAATQPPACPSHELLGGAGWFESSWELAHGLQVLEGPPLDGPATEWIGAGVRA